MKIEYIINEENKTLKKYTNSLEIKMTQAIIKKDYDKAINCLDKLINLYDSNTHLKVISLLIYKIYEFINDENKTSNREFHPIKGELYAVFYVLAVKEDYYRLSELINKYFLDEKDDEVDIKKVCYIALVDAIINLNNYNVKKLKYELEFYAHDNKQEILEGYIIPSLDLNFLKKMEEKIQIDDKLDYYIEYLVNYENYDYQGAYENLKKYQIQLEEANIFKSFKYIINELEILTRMDSKKDIYIKLVKEAKNKQENNNYYEAIILYLNALKIIPNLHLNAYIGECYALMDEIETAIDFYGMAQFYMSPKEIEDFMNLLYKNENWNDIILMYNQYSEYEDSNLRLIYMCSIAALNLGMYTEAADFLDLYEVVNEDQGNSRIDFTYERNIIEDLENELNVDLYDMDIYNLHLLTEDEKILKEYIDLNMINDDNISTRQIEYLICIIKIYIDNNDLSNAKKVLDVINNRINDTNDVKLKKRLKKYSSFYSLFII